MTRACHRVSSCLIAACVLMPALPAAGQGLFVRADDAPAVSIRPFVTFSDEKFTATKTFKAVFGQDTATWWGGGLDVVVWGGRIYGEVGASRLTQAKATLVGERVFVNEGKSFGLGIPLRAKIQPLDVSVGVRFNGLRRLVPYVGAGAARYRYSEESDFATAAENVDITRTGRLIQGGVELRIRRWMGAAIDLRYASVKGILGTAGVSKEFRENDLGGFSARAKFVVGR